MTKEAASLPAANHVTNVLFDEYTSPAGVYPAGIGNMAA
jgi:hypothetical protein